MQKLESEVQSFVILVVQSHGCWLGGWGAWFVLVGRTWGIVVAGRGMGGMVGAGMGCRLSWSQPGISQVSCS